MVEFRKYGAQGQFVGYRQQSRYCVTDKQPGRRWHLLDLLLNPSSAFRVRIRQYFDFSPIRFIHLDPVDMYFVDTGDGSEIQPGADKPDLISARRIEAILQMKGEPPGRRARRCDRTIEESRHAHSARRVLDFERLKNNAVMRHLESTAAEVPGIQRIWIGNVVGERPLECNPYWPVHIGGPFDRQNHLDR